MHLNNLSESLLFAVKRQEAYSTFIESFSDINELNIANNVKSDDNKKAFWINIYNAYFQILRRDQQVSKSVIYKEKLITFNGFKLSLDDIEHGILRRFRFKFALGLIPNLFTPRLIKRLAVNSTDFRIHFALNCGAVSCPPIAFYNSEAINNQLDKATVSFLEGDVKIDDSNRILRISQLFKWYWFDFGGKKGIYKIINQYLSTDVSGYSLVYNDYSWEDDLNNYSIH